MHAGPLKFKPENHIFKAVLAAAGAVTLGFIGFIFGLAGGALVDQLTIGLRRKNQLRNFYRKPAIKSRPELTEAAGAAVILRLCGTDAARFEIAAAALPGFFPEAPACCPEILAEDRGQNKGIDYPRLAETFGRSATEAQKSAFAGYLAATGLEDYAARIMRGQPESEAARLLKASGFSPGPPSGTDARETAADYILLGLPPDAGAAELKKVYRRLAAAFHPDSGDGLSPRQRKLSEDAFKRIQAAYERLSSN